MRNFFARYKKMTIELFQIGLGQALATLGGLIGVRLLTYVMTPSAYGEVALSMTFLILIQQLVMGPITNGFARYFSISRENDGLRDYLKAVGGLLLKSSAITLGVFLLISSGLIITGNWARVGLLFLSFLYTLVSNYNVALDNIQNAARQRVVVAWHQGLSQWLRFLLAAGIILFCGSTSVNAMFGYFLSAIVVITSQWYFFQRSSIYKHQIGEMNDKRVGPEFWQSKMIQFAMPFSMWGLFTWAQMASDRWALQTYQSVATVGLYSVLYQLGYYPITILTGVFVQFISPILYSRVGDASKTERVQSTQRFTNQLALASLGFTGVMAIIAWIVHEPIFSILVAPEYQGVAYLLPWMALSGGLFAVGQIAALTALNNNQPHKLIKPKISTSILGVALSFVGAHLYGLVGVVAAGVVFSLIYFVWVYWIFRS